MSRSNAAHGTNNTGNTPDDQSADAHKPGHGPRAVSTAGGYPANTDANGTQATNPATEETRASYDRVAAEYVRHVADELEHKPLERDLLAQFARDTRNGKVCDVGCGPGHVTAYLRACGADAFGVDLSPAMVEEARKLNPGARFEPGDMRALPVADAALDGVVAFYSLLHLPREGVVEALREFARALRDDGLLLVGIHVGDEVRHLDDWWGEPVTLDFVFFGVDEMVGYLLDADFEVVDVIERDPYPGVEVQTQRAYFLASNKAREQARKRA